ncbi:hypothetical protein A4A49_59994, partial [Nicotiana attenuata]
RDNILLKSTTHQAAKYAYLAASVPKISHKTTLAKNIKWNPPNTHFYKLNTDGAYSDNTAGIRGLIRNSKAEWILGFTGSAPHESSTFAELYELTQGLKMVYENNIRPLEVEVDAKEITILLHTDNIAFPNMINDCMYYCGQLGNPVVRHAYREQNMVADQLAKAGHNFGTEYSPSVFEVVPTFVALSFKKDKESLRGPQSSQDIARQNQSGNMDQIPSFVISCHDDNSNRMTMTTENTRSNLRLCNTTMVCDRESVTPQTYVR